MLVSQACKYSDVINWLTKLDFPTPAAPNIVTRYAWTVRVLAAAACNKHPVCDAFDDSRDETDVRAEPGYDAGPG